MAYDLNDTELYYFNEGISTAAYRALGCHRVTSPSGETVWRFAVWAPNARAVSVVGDFNAWDPAADPMEPVGTTGVWQAHLGFVTEGNNYKYSITAPDGSILFKADPYAVRAERGGTASVAAELPAYEWHDGNFLAGRHGCRNRPMSIYEVHLGSWKKGLSYRDLAHELVDYAAEMGYTHIEIMPVMAYPYDPSWGYQVTGYYAPTTRYGSPEDLMYFVDRAHERGLGVIMDWVPAHFTRDDHGLRRFDGTPLYEHPDPRRSDMPQWGTLLFDYDRTQVQSFLLSSALFWLQEYHFDGIRVDAVSCMLYLDFCKGPGEWLPNQYGDNRNLAAVTFLRKLSKAVSKLPYEKMLFAEESSAYPGVTHSVSEGGLGFTFKWNMGWMNDILSYMEMDSVYRKYHHDKLTFSMCYAFSEYYVLPFSHDEVVCGKRSLIEKMPGDYFQRFAQLRLLFGYQFAHPGKKLMFMGDEFAQFIEWRFGESLDWMLLGYEAHDRMRRFVRDLNYFYRENAPLFEIDDSWDGFTWCSVDDADHSVVSFLRTDRNGHSLACCFNFTPVPHGLYMMGLPWKAELTEVFSSDCREYGGTGDWWNPVRVSEAGEYGGHPYRVSVTLPPYGAVFFRCLPFTD